MLPPTASHAVAAVHETASSWLDPGSLDGAGRDIGCHATPFHTSANGVVAGPGGLGEQLEKHPPPTATHAIADVHETAASEVEIAPLGTGVGCTYQLLRSSVRQAAVRS